MPYFPGQVQEQTSKQCKQQGANDKMTIDESEFDRRLSYLMKVDAEREARYEDWLRRQHLAPSAGDTDVEAALLNAEAGREARD